VSVWRCPILYLPPPRRLCCRRCLSVCLLETSRRNSRTDLPEFFREYCQWANEKMIKFWWRSGSPSGYRDCFRIRQYWEIRKVISTQRSRLILQPTAPRDAAVLGRHRHSNYDVITSPALCGGIHYPSASSFVMLSTACAFVCVFVYVINTLYFERRLYMFVHLLHCCF